MQLPFAKPVRGRKYDSAKLGGQEKFFLNPLKPALFCSFLKPARGRKYDLATLLHQPKPVHHISIIGIHAREHLPVCVGTFLLYNYAIHSELGDKLNFHILPVINPDGFHYSTRHNMMWRKNRRPSNDSECSGVDLNRNFGFKWGVSGVQMEECSYVYPGSKPFSEKESHSVLSYLNQLPELPELGLDIHSYGNKLLYPYGYQQNTFPDNVDELRAMGEKAITKIPGMEMINSADLCKSDSTLIFAPTPCHFRPCCWSSRRLVERNSRHTIRVYVRIARV